MSSITTAVAANYRLQQWAQFQLVNLGERHLFLLPAGSEISGKSIVILTKRITGAIRLLSCFLI